jgi:hypothetical protein
MNKNLPLQHPRRPPLTPSTPTCRILLQIRHLLPSVGKLCQQASHRKKSQPYWPREVCGCTSIAPALAGGIPAPQRSTFASNNSASGITSLPLSNSQNMAPISPYSTIGHDVAPQATSVVQFVLGLVGDPIFFFPTFF